MTTLSKQLEESAISHAISTRTADVPWPSSNHVSRAADSALAMEWHTDNRGLDCGAPTVGAAGEDDDLMEVMADDEFLAAREREHFRAAFAADAAREQEIKGALEGGALDRIRKHVLARHSFVQGVWEAEAQAEAETAGQLDHDGDPGRRERFIARLRDIAMCVQLVAAGFILFIVVATPLTVSVF